MRLFLDADYSVAIKRDYTKGNGLKVLSGHDGYICVLLSMEIDQVAVAHVR